jgi:hypothetical protein
MEIAQLMCSIREFSCLLHLSTALLGHRGPLGAFEQQSRQSPHVSSS